jgi:hypothetical protein
MEELKPLPPEVEYRRQRMLQTMKFEVLMAVTVNKTDFWNVMLCSLLDFTDTFEVSATFILLP